MYIKNNKIEYKYITSLKHRTILIPIDLLTVNRTIYNYFYECD